ncbi:MAG: hypothetical protein BWK80_23575, partial [Desulfobacteraceae bacterium IS3]
AEFRKVNRRVPQRYILKLCVTLRELCETLRFIVSSREKILFPFIPGITTGSRCLPQIKRRLKK